MDKLCRSLSLPKGQTFPPFSCARWRHHPIKFYKQQQAYRGPAGIRSRFLPLCWVEGEMSYQLSYGDVSCRTQKNSWSNDAIMQELLHRRNLQTDPPPCPHTNSPESDRVLLQIWLFQPRLGVKTHFVTPPACELL